MTGYLTIVIITGIVSVAMTAVLVQKIVTLILRQIKLYHSITLVELKTQKIIYWIFAAVIGFFIFYVIMQMADPDAPSVTEFYELFGVGRLYTNIALMFVLIVMIAAEAFVVMLGISKNAVVDKGIYTNFDMLDWHQVRDYIIDEKRSVLVLSSDKKTFSTLRNITTPFRVAKSDIQKLEFILNKNKNKFSGFDAHMQVDRA
ncbi:MAG: hypothetical protein J1F69_00390 [Clostridiales bacterium]|nr:hypothetical protein [Clostridiales bacterium]